MSDLVAVPRPDLVRVLQLVETHVPGSVLTVDAVASFRRVVDAARGPKTGATLAGPGRAPYGFVWRDSRLFELPEEQKVIAEVRRLRGPGGSGLSFRQIAEVLNKDGRRAPSGGLWRSESVRRVLAREARTTG